MSAPVYPISRVPKTAGKVFPRIHVGGTNGRLVEGCGVMASVNGDAIYSLLFPEMPSPLPSGTPTLRLLALANATSGSAKVNPKWASIAAAENPDTITLNAEGTQTLTWAAGDNDDFKKLDTTLDADTLVAGEQVIMELTFETASWTLAQASTWIPSIVWL